MLPTTFSNVLSPTLSDRITNRYEGTTDPFAIVCNSPDWRVALKPR